MEFIPHDYQKRAIDLAVRLPKLGLFLDMGLGKTVITLTAIQELMYNRFEAVSYTHLTLPTIPLV